MADVRKPNKCTILKLDVGLRSSATTYKTGSYAENNRFDPLPIYRTYIKPYDNLSANKVADALGVARNTFNHLLNGISDLSPEMAVRLSAVLGGSAESWLRTQENYDLWKAREKVDTDKLSRIKFNAVA